MSSSTLPKGVVYVIGDRESIQLFKGAGFHVIEAYTQEQVIDYISRIDVLGNAALIIVLRDLVSDEEAFRKKTAKFSTPIYIMPTLKSPGKPVDPS
ncbi:MAG: V-type ATP synthase subunit F, partial [Acidilobaceae archaeon]